MDYRKDLLTHKIEIACGLDFDTTDSIENAMDLFKKIKKHEQYNPDGERDYKQELEDAKTDLVLLFGVKSSELAGLTKNKIYMLHQSMMVNTIYAMLKGF